ncbi:guanosine polyphosphate synthetase/pyrophosphohydrolase [Rivularia sp. PCC 7116]|uniref:HD domain-containing protein n=1 Tax=Rivularia sp. PCC 7116 TaxID=373994 RepID=UPI00029F2377|nr:HD domain-containing protein [Rivularia sp. PCC 7116]AFY55880.1 guanosine polyphosphate synthetase/pyrophosphohydrolase [Rivularia sp. PCC 7116]
MILKQPAKLTTKFEQALIYATQLHANQTRKVDKIPYISHLMSVSALILEAGGTEDEAIAGLLHDAIEDQGGKATREEIRQKFGETVVEIVDGCTETDITPKPPWKERKIDYIENIRKGSDSVKLVSFADKLHNARSLLIGYRNKGDKLWDYFSGSKEDKLWFYGELLEIYQQSCDNFMTVELERILEELGNH